MLEYYFCPLYKNRLIVLISSVTQDIYIRTGHWLKVVLFGYICDDLKTMPAGG